MFRSNRARAGAVVALVAVCIVVTAVAYAPAAHIAAAPVSRQPLAQSVAPAGARGRTLGLTRVTVPAHAKIALHHHAGTQIAYIERGTLTYTVRSGGHVDVMRGPADANPVRVRRIGPGQTGPIRAGQWIVEQPSMIHRAANNGSRPVVILLATLFLHGAPPSIPVASAKRP